MRQVMPRTRQRSHMPDLIELTRRGEGFRNVGFLQVESGTPGQMRQVGARSGDEIVQRQHFMTIAQQAVAQVRTDESRRPRNQMSQIESLLLVF